MGTNQDRSRARISIDVNAENPSPPNGIAGLAFYDESDASNDISLP